MDCNPIIIAGRGASVYSFDFPPGIPVMAVSSGIFAVQNVSDLRYFVSLDTPRFFVGDCCSSADIAWGNDPDAVQWPFWQDHELEKHVPKVAAKDGYTRPAIPYQVLEKLPAEDRQAIQKTFDENPGLIGYQPGWMDYQNVHAWDVKPQAAPNFTEDGPFGLHSEAAVDAGFDAVRHSMLFAVQVAARLGYTFHLFIGCDLHGHRFPVQRETMAEWYRKHAMRAGLCWLNLAPKSALAKILPTYEQCPPELIPVDIASPSCGGPHW